MSNKFKNLFLVCTLLCTTGFNTSAYNNPNYNNTNSNTNYANNNEYNVNKQNNFMYQNQQIPYYNNTFSKNTYNNINPQQFNGYNTSTNSTNNWNNKASQNNTQGNITINDFTIDTRQKIFELFIRPYNNNSNNEITQDKARAECKTMNEILCIKESKKNNTNTNNINSKNTGLKKQENKSDIAIAFEKSNYKDGSRIEQVANALLRENIWFYCNYSPDKNNEVLLLFIEAWKYLKQTIIDTDAWMWHDLMNRLQSVLQNVLPLMNINDFNEDKISIDNIRDINMTLNVWHLIRNNNNNIVKYIKCKVEELNKGNCDFKAMFDILNKTVCEPEKMYNLEYFINKIPNEYRNNINYYGNNFMSYLDNLLQTQLNFICYAIASNYAIASDPEKYKDLKLETLGLYKRFQGKINKIYNTIYNKSNISPLIKEDLLLIVKKIDDIFNIKYNKMSMNEQYIYEINLFNNILCNIKWNISAINNADSSIKIIEKIQQVFYKEYYGQNISIQYAKIDENERELFNNIIASLEGKINNLNIKTPTCFTKNNLLSIIKKIKSIL